MRLNPKGRKGARQSGVAFIGLNRFDEAKEDSAEAQGQKLETESMHARLYQIAFVQGDAAA